MLWFVCCAVSATMITGLIFFPVTTDSHQYVTQTSLFQHLSDYNITCAHLQQGSATAYTTNNSMSCLESVYSQKVICKRLWPPESPHLNLCDRLLLSISTVNQPDALGSQIYLFWFNTLHVSDGLSIHHQEFKTVHTATGICRTDTATCLLVGIRWNYGFISFPLASR
jgi:hypothetical protein